MRVDVIPIRELSDGMKQKWLDIQASNPNLAGPCFHPELFMAAGNTLSNIFVIVLYNNNGPVGLLPFAKHQGLSVAKRIHLCQYEAIISSPSQFWNMNKILRKSGLEAWEFKYLADFGNIKSKRGWFEKIDSPRVDLTNGYEKYLDYQNHRKISYENLMYKRRLLERRIGSIRFVPTCNDVGILHRTLSWKADQFDCNSDWLKWTTGMLEYIYFLKNSSLSGVLSTLYAGDDLVAAIFSLRSQGIMYLSIISFNPSFSKYSPGLLLLYYLISELHTFQCRILDFGPGAEQKYKWDFSNSTFPVISGNFEVSSIKKKIKSINWLYQGLLPLVRSGRKIIAHLQ
jgi:CelD/BcsL family acetyltransferase involved in cellulose biosynthesis